MARLVWHEEGQNKVEYGVDRGVYYSPIAPDVYSYGVVWNGLTEVTESSVGGEIASYHFDGIKYVDTVEPRNYQATITAYSAPDQFATSLGEKHLIPGFILTRQSRTLFGLTYRTFVGQDLGYKIHLVYNALASPLNRQYPTMKRDMSAELLSWKIDAVPPIGSDYRPSAHFILDSVKMGADLLGMIEEIIYGTDDTVARLPSIEELRDLVALWNPLIILPQSTTGLAGLVSGMGDLYTTSMEGINKHIYSGRLVPSSINGLYRLE